MSAGVREHRVRRFTLRDGHVLQDVVQAYTLLGELNAARDNLVVIFHSLTSPPDPREWWAEAVGAGRPIDTDRYAVLTTNLLGSCYGTTPLPAGATVTPRDMAALVKLLVDELGVSRVALATGGSLGGMVTLEWVASFPELTRAAVVFAAPAAHTAQAIGYNHVQREAIRLGGEAGLELARMIGMLTYRTPAELEQRFGRARRADGVFEVQSYLAHQGEKLRRRFSVSSYLALMDAMDAHDVGAGRGGVGPALRAFRGRLVGVGIRGDQLYPPEQVRAWVDAAGARYREIDTVHGHDAFLLEAEQVGAIVGEALERLAVRRRRQRPASV